MANKVLVNTASSRKFQRGADGAHTRMKEGKKEG